MHQQAQVLGLAVHNYADAYHMLPCDYSWGGPGGFGGLACGWGAPRPTNRFLTIVCTDGGDTYDGDRFILGDPQILLQPATKKTPEADSGKDMAAEK